MGVGAWAVDFKFKLDTQAFTAGGQPQAAEQPVPLPKLMGVSLHSVLALLIAQLPLDNGTFGRFRVHEGAVLLTSDVLPEFDVRGACAVLHKTLEQPVVLENGIDALVVPEPQLTGSSFVTIKTEQRL